MVKHFSLALGVGFVVVSYMGLQAHVPVQAQSQASSEADSEASSEASSQASSQASSESQLVYSRRTGYQVYHPMIPEYMQPLGPSGYPWQIDNPIKPWPPAYMQPTAYNGWPAWSQSDPSWVYWVSHQPAEPLGAAQGYPYPYPYPRSYPNPYNYPGMGPIPAPAVIPGPVVVPPSTYGMARIIPHRRAARRNF